MNRIIVCIKPVPDPKHWNKVAMDPVTQTLKREGIPTIINPLDKHALEAALCMRDQLGGEVVLLSMAPALCLHHPQGGPGHGRRPGSPALRPAFCRVGHPGDRPHSGCRLPLDRAVGSAALRQPFGGRVHRPGLYSGGGVPGRAECHARGCPGLDGG